MPDRLAELLSRANSGRLSAKETEELVRLLNAPIMPPPGQAQARFVSKHTFEPSDLKGRIEAIRWFSKCGELRALDLTMGIERVESWSAAMQACQSIGWENAQLEASNQLTVWLHQHDRARYALWNEIVAQHKKEVVIPLLERTLAPFQLEHGLGPALTDAISWDVLGALMENSYLGSRHRAFFFLELLWVYEAGHFPCGWLGGWPAGKLIVYG